MPALAIVALTALSDAVALAIGVPALVPLLNTLAAFPFMYASLGRGQVAQAIARMLVWAAVLGASATILAYARPLQTARLFLHAPAYEREMLAWVLTGQGAESDPARFIPQHAADAAIFCGLSLTTGGAAAMPMGAALMNYMGHYVGALAARSPRPLPTAVLAWHPWALVRIASFVTLGVLLAGPLLSRIGRFPFQLRAHTRLFGAAAVGLILDVLLKWMLAPAWRRLLAGLLGVA